MRVNYFTLNSRDSRMWFSIISSSQGSLFLIQVISEGDGQVASGSVSLPDPVVLETEE